MGEQRRNAPCLQPPTAGAARSQREDAARELGVPAQCTAGSTLDQGQLRREDQAPEVAAVTEDQQVLGQQLDTVDRPTCMDLGSAEEDCQVSVVKSPSVQLVHLTAATGKLSFTFITSDRFH